MRIQRMKEKRLHSQAPQVADEVAVDTIEVAVDVEGAAAAEKESGGVITATSRVICPTTVRGINQDASTVIIRALIIQRTSASSSQEEPEAEEPAIRQATIRRRKGRRLKDRHLLPGNVP